MAEPIPNLLFKYLGEEGGIKTLENLTLMFSNPADLNDPFEFLPRLELSPQSRDDERTSKAKNQVRDYGRNSFIFCMTSKEHNVRMWDHYGDKHQGLMIQLVSERLWPNTVDGFSAFIMTPKSALTPWISR